MTSKDKSTRIIRRVARIWSLVIIAITIFIIFANLFFPDPGLSPDFPWTEYLLPLTMILSVAGLALAWRWELLGGAINVGLFIFHQLLFFLLRGEVLPMQVTLLLLPAAIPGVLFLICWRRSYDE